MDSQRTQDFMGFTEEDRGIGITTCFRNLEVAGDRNKLEM